VLGVHWFSDVLFGSAFGITWGVAVALVARRVEWADLMALIRPTPKPSLGLAGDG
jgi:membrane-associated phospholipid phosphatase